MKRELERFERWMLSELEQPLESARSKTSRMRRIEREVLPSATLTSLQRLALYSDLIHTRFVGCLRGDFPATEHALGARRFEKLGRRFVELHPSRHFSLNTLGAKFPDFLAQQSVPRYVAHLAELERAMQDVFDARSDPLLSSDELRARPQRRWSTLRLRPITALKLVHAPFAINAYLQAVLDGHAEPSIVRRKTHTLVWRNQFVVWRRDLDPDEAHTLQHILDGSTLSTALASISPSSRTHIAAWFERWSTDGLLRSLARRGATNTALASTPVMPTGRRNSLFQRPV